MPGNDNREPAEEKDLPLEGDVPPPNAPSTPDGEALLVALVLAPATFSRNRFFELFRQRDPRAVRRRAQLLRSLILELTEPWPHSTRITATMPPQVTRKIRDDGFLELVITAEEFGYRRTAILTKLEASALDYALHRAVGVELTPEARDSVLEALARLGQGWLSEFPS